MRNYRVQLPIDKRAPWLWHGIFYSPDADGFINNAPADLCKALGVLPQGEPEPPPRAIPREFVFPLPAQLPNMPPNFRPFAS